MNIPRIRQIAEAKQNSKRDGHAIVLLKNRYRREYFRYENGEIAEYDCSRYRGNPVELTREEEAVINQMNYSHNNNN